MKIQPIDPLKQLTKDPPNLEKKTETGAHFHPTGATGTAERMNWDDVSLIHFAGGVTWKI